MLQRFLSFLKSIFGCKKPVEVEPAETFSGWIPDVPDSRDQIFQGDKQ